MSESESETRLYTLHTRAPFEVVREVACTIAMRTGHTALLEEHPLEQEHSPWTRARWSMVLAVQCFAALALPSVIGANGLAGYGIGWVTAAIVLLWGRGSRAKRPVY